MEWRCVPASDIESIYRYNLNIEKCYMEMSVLGKYENIWFINLMLLTLPIYDNRHNLSWLM